MLLLHSLGNICVLPRAACGSVLLQDHGDGSQIADNSHTLASLALGSEHCEESQEAQKDHSRMHQSRTTVTNKISEADSANNESQRARLMMLFGL